MTHGSSCGVGLSLNESPDDDSPLRASDVVTIESRLYDPARGGVRLEELVIIPESGIEVLGDGPPSVRPQP